MKSVEEQFLGTSKSLASTLMIKMITMKYDGHSGMREHYDTPKPRGLVDNLSTCGIPVSIAYLDTTISLPIHWDPFMHIYFRKIYKFIKTVHKSLSYNPLIYKILHIKSSCFFFYKKVSQSHSSAFFTPAVPDECQSPVHNLHLKGDPTTG